jgi:hypothetical protein
MVVASRDDCMMRCDYYNHLNVISRIIILIDLAIAIAGIVVS